MVRREAGQHYEQAANHRARNMLADSADDLSVMAGQWLAPTPSHKGGKRIASLTPEPASPLHIRLQGGQKSDAKRQTSTFNAAINASCGMSTFPYWRIFFLPSFCFSRSLRLRVASPP